MTHLWHWLGDVADHIGNVSVYWLVLALALKTGESAFVGLTWRNILRAAYPKAPISFKTSWGAAQGGAALNAITPAQAGTAAMIGIFRSSIPGSTVSGIASAAVVQSLFFIAASVLMVIGVAFIRPHTVSKGAGSRGTGNLLGSHPVLLAVIAVVLVAALYPFRSRIDSWLKREWRKAKSGAAIFSDRRRYARQVAAPSAASFACRIGVNVVFLAAFAIAITTPIVLLISASHMLSRIFAITPAGVGQTQALDVVTLRGYAPATSTAAFSVTQDAVLVTWNVVLGVLVMAWAFGFTKMRQVLRQLPRAAPRGRGS